MKRRRAYVQSTTVCPVCGRIAVMRMFKCRCANWYGWYALRFYCRHKECPVEVVCTEFYGDIDSAARSLDKSKMKKNERKTRR